MKVFHCDHCDQLVFFENTQCVACGHTLAFLPDLMDVGSLDPEPAGADRFTSPLAPGRAAQRSSRPVSSICRSVACDRTAIPHEGPTAAWIVRTAP